MLWLLTWLSPVMYRFMNSAGSIVLPSERQNSSVLHWFGAEANANMLSTDRPEPMIVCGRVNFHSVFSSPARTTGEALLGSVSDAVMAPVLVLGAVHLPRRPLCVQVRLRREWEYAAPSDAQCSSTHTSTHTSMPRHGYAAADKRSRPNLPSTPTYAMSDAQATPEACKHRIRGFQQQAHPNPSTKPSSKLSRLWIDSTIEFIPASGSSSLCSVHTRTYP